VSQESCPVAADDSLWPLCAEAALSCAEELALAAAAEALAAAVLLRRCRGAGVAEALLLPSGAALEAAEPLSEEAAPCGADAAALLDADAEGDGASWAMAGARQVMPAKPAASSRSFLR
jgi:hypothetical protein